MNPASCIYKQFRFVKFSLLFVSVFLSCFNSFAQHQTDKWYFGSHAGIDFSGSMPYVMTNGSLNNMKGSSSMSDSAGNLLFYSDGQKVWNRYHNIMTNGSGLLGGVSTQAAVIVPKPGSFTEYYIFTNDVNGGQNGLQYSMVDISLDSSRGSVTTLNFFVQDDLTEKLAVTSNQAGDGYWITAHEYGSDWFYNYHLSNAGLDPNVIVNAVGLSHNSLDPQNGVGQMKYSPCGDKLAVAIGALGMIEIFDFDNSTGIISNPVTIPFSNPVFSLEFSPNGRVLYATTTGQANIYQMDISSGNSTDILNSAIKVDSNSTMDFGLQLAPDGKIYVGKEMSPWIGVINYPDSTGIACYYVDSVLDLSPGTAGLCLPAFVASYFHNPIACQFSTGISDVNHSEINLYPNPSLSDFRIDLKEKSIIQIYDIHGRLIEELNNSSTIFFGRNYSPGLYVIHVTDNNSVKILKAIKN